MAAEVRESLDQDAQPSARRRWLRLAAAAVILLAISETVWLWQTWPVRELLELTPPPAAPAPPTP